MEDKTKSKKQHSLNKFKLLGKTNAERVLT